LLQNTILCQAITSEAFDDTAVGVLIAEIKALAADCFINFECVFKVRECNRAAHEVAKLGHLYIQGEEQVTSSIPKVIHVIVANDLLAE